MTAEFREFVEVIEVFAEVAFPFNGPLKLPAVTVPATVSELKLPFPPKEPVRYSQPVTFRTYKPTAGTLVK